jgi:hypothetical protein
MVLRYLNADFHFPNKGEVQGCPSQTATYEELGKQTSNYNVCKKLLKRRCGWLGTVSYNEKFQKISLVLYKSFTIYIMS